MGTFERYMRNRNGMQVFANYLGVIGAAIFALQNLTTNWGGSYKDDTAITDEVKANVLAGVAWEEQQLQVGALQMAWMIYVLGTELQGNLSPGRYKRVMTWMVNVPVVIFMIGNMILSTRRVADDVGSTSGYTFDVVVGIILIIISAGCIVSYATIEKYMEEPWLKVTERKLSDYYDEAPKGQATFTANRHLPQFLLHVVTILCLLYFAIVGLHHYDTMKGWLLTDLFKNDTLAVKVWGIGGATVGMGAVPIMFMFAGFELQGDLPPSNYKPLSVFVGSLNIFTVSIFMYSTTYSAFDRGVITTHVIPMIIMIVLCLWAILLVVLDGVVVPYSDAVWLKVLADPVPYKDEDVGELAVVVPGGDVGYLTPQPADRGYDKVEEPEEKDPAVEEDVGRSGDALMEPTPDRSGRAMLPPITRDDDEDEFCLKPRVEEEALADIIVSWDAPPGTEPSEIEYRLSVTEHDNPRARAAGSSRGVPSTRHLIDDEDPDRPRDETEKIIVPGHQTRYMIDEFMYEPIIPGEKFDFQVEYRYKADAGEPDGGWRGRSAQTPVRTAMMTEDAVLLLHRVPRIHLRTQLTFKSNADAIKVGEGLLPQIARLMQEYPEMTVGVEGHVNFGQKDHAAQRLSLARAERIVDALVMLGCDRHRLTASGHGWTRPRFPRHSKYSGKNRRVEFRIMPGSGLYERLAEEAAARRDTIHTGADVDAPATAAPEPSADDDDFEVDYDARDAAKIRAAYAPEGAADDDDDDDDGVAAGAGAGAGAGTSDSGRD